MTTFKGLICFGVLAGLLLGTAGCVIRDRDHYRYEHGDRVDRHGHRDVGWCDHHHDDDHCRR